MSNESLLESVDSAHDAELVIAAQRCIMAALDHSRAPNIILVEEGVAADKAPRIELPPRAMRAIANLLGMLGQQQPVMLIPQKHELTTQEIAAFLNVSRPYVVKQIENGHLKCRKVGRHRRVEFQEVLRFQQLQKQNSEDALQRLADMSQEFGLEP